MSHFKVQYSLVRFEMTQMCDRKVCLALALGLTLLGLHLMHLIVGFKFILSSQNKFFDCCVRPCIDRRCNFCCHILLDNLGLQTNPQNVCTTLTFDITIWSVHKWDTKTFYLNFFMNLCQRSYQLYYMCSQIYCHSVGCNFEITLFKNMRAKYHSQKKQVVLW